MKPSGNSTLDNSAPYIAFSPVGFSYSGTAFVILYSFEYSTFVPVKFPFPVSVSFAIYVPTSVGIFCISLYFLMKFWEICC